jgi:hypothetical protein
MESETIGSISRGNIVTRQSAPIDSIIIEMFPVSSNLIAPRCGEHKNAFDGTGLNWRLEMIGCDYKRVLVVP